MRTLLLKTKMIPNWKRAGQILAVLLVLALFTALVPQVVKANKEKELVIFPESDTMKREVVYAKLTPGGAVSQIYVVNHFHPLEETALTDYGDYESVIQLTGEEAPLLEGGKVTVPRALGHYYYQGNLKSRELPWLFDIIYLLDGVLTAPENLSGARGNLEIQLAVRPNPAVDTLFYDSYALQIGLPLDPDRAVVKAASEGFVLSSAGTEHQLNYIVLPGQETVIRLLMEVEDFAMGQITIAGVLLSFDIDLEEMEEELQPLDDLSSGIAEFSDGIGQIADGYRELMKAFREIRDGSGQLAEGSQLLDEGVQELKEGVQALAGEGKKLKTGSAQILAGLSEMAANLPDKEIFESLDLPEFGEEDLERLEEAREFLKTLEQVLQLLADHEAELEEIRGELQEIIEWLRQLDMPSVSEIPVTEEGWKALLVGLGVDPDAPLEDLYKALAALSRMAVQAEELQELLDALSLLLKGLPDLDVSTEEILEAVRGLLDQAEDLLDLVGVVGPMFSNIDQLIDGLNELYTGYKTFHYGLSLYIDQGMGGLLQGIEGTEDEPGLADGTSELSKGTSALYQGLGQYYSSGMVPFNQGLVQLDEGSSIMKDETSDLRGLFEEAIREKMDEFTNSGFEPTSFVSGRNREVESVQFVFMTGEIPPAGK
ncbi:MAG TPA: hypothetical protein GX720_05555 [Clostridiaceae bacterium]|nr:hypothetical protein [Clostridiaceae bacterium]